MQTSCGSPCYAAPELVISEGLYVGSAVDIWSCGVILYAMLAGYLPFDDDPANPDGDNINLLYKYIVSTPLSFPDYISADARDLLSMMLVPDPTRRANLDSVMRHRWLSAHAGTPRTDGLPNAFGKTAEELERAALEQHQQRRLAYQRQMRAAAMAQNNNQPSGSQRTNHGREATHSGVPSRSRSTQPEYLYESSVDQSLHQSTSSPNRNLGPGTPNGSVAGKKPAYGSPSAHGITSDDPFAPPPGQASSSLGAAATAGTSSRISEEKAPVNGTTTQSSSNNKGHKQNNSGGASGFRHTIQVEYDEPRSNRRSDERRGRSSTDHTSTSTQQPPSRIPQPLQPQPQQSAKDRRASASSTKPLPASPSPSAPAPVSASAPAAPPKSSQAPPPSKIPTRSVPQSQPQQQDIPTLSVSTPATADDDATVIPTSDTKEPTKDKDRRPREKEKEKDKETASTTSATSSFSKKTGQGHRKGQSSVDKFGFVKIFGGNAGTPATPVVDSLTTATATPTSRVPSESGASASAASLLTASPDKDKEKSPSKEKEGKEEKKKTRRNTLTVMVEPISRTIRGRSGKKTATLPTEPSNASAASLAPPVPPTPSPNPSNAKVPQSAIMPASSAGSFNVDGSSVGAGEGTAEPGVGGSGMPASTSKARKVMAWFRTKSKGRDSMGILPSTANSADEEQVVNTPAVAGVNNPALTLTTPTSTTTRIPSGGNAGGVGGVPQTPSAPGHPKRTASTMTENSVMTFSTPNFVQKFRNSVTVGGSSSAKHTSSSQQTPSKQPKQPHEKLRIHHGAVDQTTITTRPPEEVMKHVKEILEGMGVEIMLESEYKYRCVRQKKRKGVVGVQLTQVGAGVNGGSGVAANGQKEGDVAAFAMLGSAASNGVCVFV